RRAEWRGGGVRPRGAAAAAAAAEHRRARRAARGRSDVRPGRPVLVGRPLVRALARRGRTRDPVAFVDERLGAARGLKFLMSYVFPDHWSFLLGEIALYSFLVLIATGTFLALFFDPSTREMTYQGAYGPLHGAQVSAA